MTDLADRLAEAIATGRAPDLHGVVAIHRGERVLEHYGTGEDFSWGDSLGVVTFGSETLHDVRSVSKSVVGLLYGIALAGGLVPEPEEPLLPQFPECSDLAGDPKRARLTVEHALTMTLGLEWNEDLPYTSPDNSEIAMEFAPDRYRYVLERPIVEEPGTTWLYCGGATALLAKLIAKGVGLPLEDFARERLFEPLGIDVFEWMRGADGEASAASGLRLTPRDLARIGQTVLGDGDWEGRQLVDEGWLRRALRPHATMDEGFEYGYQWYVSFVDGPDGARHSWVGGIGNGGQRLHVVPDLHLVVAIMGGAYDAEDQWSMPETVFADVVVGGIGEGSG
jgi:CubicO group peptidase (beta-lactamase class C family)